MYIQMCFLYCQKDMGLCYSVREHYKMIKTVQSKPFISVGQNIMFF